MNKCKDCLGYEAGFDGKPATCKILKVADTWNGYDNLRNDGVGYSDENYDKECSVLFVGPDFGCNKFQSTNYSIH